MADDAASTPPAVGGDPSDMSEEIEPMSFRRRTARLLALLAIVLMLGLWGWALFFPPATKAPGTLTDRTFPDAAEPICTDAAAALANLPAAFETPDPVDRANVVRRSDVILGGMLDRLDAVAPPVDSGNEARNIDEWLSDWRTYVGDRENYADALTDDPQARFYVTEKEKRQITAPIDFFATFNQMPNCVTPDDIE